MNNQNRAVAIVAEGPNTETRSLIYPEEGKRRGRRRRKSNIMTKSGEREEVTEAGGPQDRCC